MKNKIDYALALAAKGYHVFPLLPGSKDPAIKGFPVKATTEETVITKWWTTNPDYNVGISTSAYNGHATGALIVVDVDNKNGKRGDDTLFDLDLQHGVPPTTTFHTPTGGRHLLYYHPEPVNQRKPGFLGEGIDIRSRGGYIVAPGSTVPAGRYVPEPKTPLKPTTAPQWLPNRLGVEAAKPAADRPPAATVDPVKARKRAIKWLNEHPPGAQLGERNHQAFKTAARLKDHGVMQGEALDLMLTYWNDYCEPPLAPEEVEHCVRSAFQYGREAPGSAAPEAAFEPVEETMLEDCSPVETLNKEYAFVVAGGGHHILRETVDEHGAARLDHLSEPTFHRMHAAKQIQVGDGKLKALTQIWMGHKDRRSYPNGMVFAPNFEAPPGFYNLWRGFTVEPLPGDHVPSDTARAAVDAWSEHLLQNVCQGSKPLAKWLFGYFAHCIQHPDRKPLVALVFRGGKGVGKNALVERFAELLGRGQHAMVTSNRRYLVGNFNGHLERCLLFVLDEAFWSGDKQAEGQLKDIITGSRHVIEHKGKEPYSVKNLTRVVIIGNEDWLVPATEDERRYAVFDVGDGRKQDRKFFADMRKGMAANESEGYRLLLTALLHHPLEGVDVNHAPNTKGLYEQKLASMEPLPEWWFNCLADGCIKGAPMEEAWPEVIKVTTIYEAFKRWVKDRSIRTRIPGDRQFGRQLRRYVEVERTRLREGGTLPYAYRLPPLQDAKAQWAKHMGADSSEWE